MGASTLMITAWLLTLSSLALNPPSAEHTLRMSYQEGALHHVLIESTTTVQGAAPETIRMRVTRRVLEVKGSRARIETELNELDFGENDPRNALFSKLEGSAWRGWVDERGRFEALTLNPPQDLPRLLMPMARKLQRLLPGRSLPLPQAAQRVGDDWLIPAKDLAASPEGSWAKSAEGGLYCTLTDAQTQRATISIELKAPLGKQKELSGKGQMVVNLGQGIVESFRLKNRIVLETKVAGDTSRTEITQDYRLTSRPGVTP